MKEALFRFGSEEAFSRYPGLGWLGWGMGLANSYPELQGPG